MKLLRKLLKKYNLLREKGAFSVATKIKRALERKGDKLGIKKEKKDKKEKKARGYVLSHLCAACVYLFAVGERKQGERCSEL